MKSPAGPFLKRIFLALALSILVHSLLLWQWPKFELPNNTVLPPLQAKLEPLPKLTKQPAVRKPKLKPLPTTRPEGGPDIAP